MADTPKSLGQQRREAALIKARARLAQKRAAEKEAQRRAALPESASVVHADHSPANGADCS